MAILNVINAPGFAVDIDYNTANGRVNDVTVTNTGDRTWRVKVWLTAGGEFTRDFPPTAGAVGYNVGGGFRIGTDENGDPMLTGIAGFACWQL